MEPNVFVKAEIPLDVPICQYMRLDYFISLLATGEYFVRPRCEFEDAFEANLPLPKMFTAHEAGKTVPSEVREDEMKKCQRNWRPIGRTANSSHHVGVCKRAKTC